MEHRRADLQEYLTHPAAADAALAALRAGGATGSGSASAPRPRSSGWPGPRSRPAVISCSAPRPGPARRWPPSCRSSAVSSIPPNSSPAPSVRCLYIAPLKALTNDVCRNLSDCLDGLAAFLPDGAALPRLAVRTGDTPGPERQAFRHDPPEVLLTTPESLAVLLSQPALLPLFAGLRWVVVDEVHALAPTKRGADLALSLERLSAVAPSLQRVGLSATAAPLAEAARFLAGVDRPCAIAEVCEETPLDLRVVPLADGPAFLADLIRRLIPELRACRATLIFTNTRRLAERLAWALRRRLPDWDDRIAVHHSSVAAARRREVEAAVQARPAARGGQQHQPGTRHRHRPGRSRRAGASARRRRAAARSAWAGRATGRAGCGAAWCSRHRPPNCWRPSSPAPRGGPRSASRCGRRRTRWTCSASRSPAWPRRQRGRPTSCTTWPGGLTPIATLQEIDFDDCLAYLRGLDRDGRPWLPPRLRGEPDALSIRDERTARLLRRNLGTILAEERAPVLAPFSRDPEGSADASWSEIGDVDQAFADRLQPGDRFLLDGRCLEFRRREGATLFVEEVAGRPATPRWAGDGWAASPELARRLFLLRVQAAEALRDGPAALGELVAARLRRGRRRRPNCCSPTSSGRKASAKSPMRTSLLIEEVESDLGRGLLPAHAAEPQGQRRPGPRRGASAGPRPRPRRRRRSWPTWVSPCVSATPWPTRPASCGPS